MIDQELLNRAFKNLENAYAPYSNYRVGACVKTKYGDFYDGANIENASYSPSCCAERVAFFKAISDGYKDFEAIAISGDKENCYPCGVCRQVMSEFCDKNFKIYIDDKEYTLKDMLPYSFDLEK